MFEEEKEEGCEVCDKFEKFDVKVTKLIEEELDAQEEAGGDGADVLIIAQVLAANAADILNSLASVGAEERPQEALEVMMQGAILEGVILSAMRQVRDKMPNMRQGAILAALTSLSAKMLKQTNHERDEKSEDSEDTPVKEEVELSSFFSSLGEEE